MKTRFKIVTRFLAVTAASCQYRLLTRWNFGRR